MILLWYSFLFISLRAFHSSILKSRFEYLLICTLITVFNQLGCRMTRPYLMWASFVFLFIAYRLCFASGGQGSQSIFIDSTNVWKNIIIFNFKLSRAKKTTKFPCQSTQILLCFSYQNWITHSPHSTWPFWLNFGTKNNDPVDNIVLQFAIKTMPIAVLIQILNTITNPSFHKQYHSNANWMNKTT